MYSLGEKFRVLNASEDVAFYDSSNALVTANDSIAATNYFTVKGFGKFPLSKVTNFRGARAKAAAVESANWTVVAPTGLGGVSLGDVIETRITFRTERYQADLTNNFISGGRPLVFQTAPLTATGVNDIATAIKAGFIAYKNAFIKADLVIGSILGSNADLLITVAAGYESVSVEKVELSISRQGAGSFAKTNLSKSIVTAGTQGRGLGKFLEESIRVGTADNVRTYGMNASADTSVDVRGKYTQFSWTLTADYDEVLGNVGSDIRPSAKHDFTLFLNEATCKAADGAIHLMAAAVVQKAGGTDGIASGIVTPINTLTYGTVALLTQADTSVFDQDLFIVG